MVTLTRDSDPRLTPEARVHGPGPAWLCGRGSQRASVTLSKSKRVSPHPVTIGAEMNTNSRHVQEHRGQGAGPQPLKLGEVLAEASLSSSWKTLGVDTARELGRRARVHVLAPSMLHKQKVVLPLAA